MSIRAAAVILAGGSGSRVGAGINKVLLPLGDAPVIAHSIRAALHVPEIHRLVLVVRPEDRDEISAAVAPHLGERDLWLVDGGTERHHSEWHALLALSTEIDAGEIDVVAIHDGARPLARAALWREVIEAAARVGGALPVASLPGLLGPAGTPAPLVGVQTPQAFRATPLLAAYQQAHTDGFVGTDTASCLERYADSAIAAVASGPANLKVTWPEDVSLAARLLTR